MPPYKRCHAACQSSASRSKAVALPPGWRGVQTLRGKVQLVLDWHHRMRVKGHYPATTFPIERFYKMYHELGTTGALAVDDVAYLDSKIERWSIRQWELKKYPALRGSAPVPKRPASEGGLITMDSDDE